MSIGESITLEALDDSRRGQPRSTDEDRVRVREIGSEPECVGARLRLLVDVDHIVEAMVPDDVKAGCLPVGAPRNADGIGIRRPQAQPADAQMVKGRDDRARGGEGASTGQPVEAVQERRLARVARQIAHPCVGQRDDVRAECRQGMRRGGQRVEVAERALLHALGGAGIAGHGLEPREVDRHGRRRHPVQLRLDGRVARRHEDAQARAGRHHRLNASRPSNGKSRRPGDPGRERPRPSRVPLHVLRPGSLIGEPPHPPLLSRLRSARVHRVIEGHHDLARCGLNPRVSQT